MQAVASVSTHLLSLARAAAGLLFLLEMLLLALSWKNLVTHVWGIFASSKWLVYPAYRGFNQGWISIPVLCIASPYFVTMIA